MPTTAETRIKKRLPCTLDVETRRHNGMVLNLSARGLFVQTSLPAEPGTLLGLQVRDPERGEAIPLQAAVVWRRRVSPRMTGTNQSGMGLRLIERSTAWHTLMQGLLDEEFAAGRAGGDAPGAPSLEPTAPQRAEPAAAASRFVVRLAQAGGPRSRRVVVECANETAAAEEALRVAGAGWTVLETLRG